MHGEYDLNVVDIGILIEEVLKVYQPKGDYSLFSIDVVSMFDRISMIGVLDVIRHHMETRYLHRSCRGKEVEVYINLDVLDALVKLDSNFFDYFR